MIKSMRIGLILFGIILLVYLVNLPADFKKDLENNDHRNLMTSADVIPNTFLPYLLIKEQTFTFDSISFFLRRFDGGQREQYFLLEHNDHKYSVYPPLAGIAALPVYLIPVLLNKIPHFQYPENLLKILALGRITASFYTAIASVFMYFVFRHFSKDKFTPILFTIFFALGTTNWSVSSRGLWQHTLTVLLLSLTLLLILKSKQFFLVGILLGLLVLTRPTNAIISVFILIYLSLHEKAFKSLIIGIIPSVIFYFCYNFLVFGSPFSEGYGARNDLNWSTSLLTSIPGFLWSPARSFLFISPPLILSFIGIYLVFKSKSFFPEHKSLFKYLALIFLLSMLVFAKWWAWDGATAFGYRMLTDYLPITTLLALLVFQILRPKFKLIIILLICYSILVQANAVFYKKSRCASQDDWNFNCLAIPRNFIK